MFGFVIVLAPSLCIRVTVAINPHAQFESLQKIGRRMARERLDVELLWCQERVHDDDETTQQSE